MKSYAEQMQKQLATYRISRLGLADENQGVWSGNGLPYAHILPITLLRLNVLETIRAEFWQHAERTQIKLHKDFAHLNSSQALTFNLFFPFLGMQATYPQLQPAPLLEALGLPAREVKSWKFEAVLDPAEGTNFDCYLELVSSERIVIEVKLTEREFGIGAPNAQRRAKLHNIYVPHLMGKVRPETLEEEAFFAHYQLLRNISYADATQGHCVVFLLPRANVGLAAGAETFLEHALLPALKPFVSVVYLEDVLQSLSATALPPLLDTHTKLLQEKYLL